MRCSGFYLFTLGLLAFALWTDSGTLVAQESNHDSATPSFAQPVPGKVADNGSFELSVDEIPPHLRDKVRLVLEQPKVTHRGPAEVFPCQPEQYYWLLEHPDRAARVWLGLGAQNLTISDRGKGQFAWTDTLGSEIRWEMIYKTPQMRIWFAEGSVRPAPLLPLIPAQGVVILRFAEGRDELGRPTMRHQGDVYLTSDSRALAIVTKLAGTSTTRTAEQFLEQLELFFSAMAWYLDRHPKVAEALLSDKPLTGLVTPMPPQAKTKEDGR